MERDGKFVYYYVTTDEIRQVETAQVDIKTRFSPNCYSLPSYNDRFSAKRGATPSAGGTPGNSIFSSVSLAATPASGGGGNPFGGFSFGSSTPVPAATKPAFPAFATPAASAKPEVSKPSGSATTSVNMTKSDENISQVTKGFLKHMESLTKADGDCLQQFISTIVALSGETKATEKPKTASSTSSWDSSRSLFGGAKPLVSPTAGGSAPAPAATTNLFGASAPSPAPATGGFSFSATKPTSSPAGTGGFSFNPTKTGAAAAPVPAFSFSTAQSAAVKEAAKAAATASASKASKPDDAGDDANQEEDANGSELEAANDDYDVLYKTKTKILHVSKNIYIKGLLKIEKNKESGKYRLVVRDAVSGRVKMNSAISKGMPLSKAIVPATKKKGPTPIVIIKAMFDENSKEPEDFKLITSTDEHENLYSELKKLV